MSCSEPQHTNTNGCILTLEEVRFCPAMKEVIQHSPRAKGIVTMRQITKNAAGKNVIATTAVGYKTRPAGDLWIFNSCPFCQQPTPMIEVVK